MSTFTFSFELLKLCTYKVVGVFKHVCAPLALLLFLEHFSPTRHYHCTHYAATQQHAPTWPCKVRPAKTCSQSIAVLRI